MIERLIYIGEMLDKIDRVQRGMRERERERLRERGRERGRERESDRERGRERESEREEERDFSPSLKKGKEIDKQK